MRLPWLAVLLFTLPALLPAQASGVRLRYLGTAGWEITDGRTVILVDPYLTRLKQRTPNDTPLTADTRVLVNPYTAYPSDTAVINAHLTRADAIVVTHTHPDHFFDVPFIARKTGALVVGTASTGLMARVQEVPPAQIRVVQSGDSVAVNGVSIRVVRSLHGIFAAPVAGAAPPAIPVVSERIMPPFTLNKYQEGGTLAYLIRIGGKQILVFGSMNFVESELTGLRPDVAIIGGMPDRQYIDNYTPRIMAALGNPPIVFPTHWDAFNRPYGSTQESSILRVQAFVNEVKAASPTTRVIVPTHLVPIVLDTIRVR